MKLIDLTCSKCGAQLKVNPELSKCMCQYCGNEMLIDQEIIHHKIDNAFDFGYQAEMGRQSAQYKNEIILAQNALTTKSWNEVAIHYKNIERADPNNIEAIYFSRFAELMINLSDINYILIREDKFNSVLQALDIINQIIGKNEDYKHICRVMHKIYSESVLAANKQHIIRQDKLAADKKQLYSYFRKINQQIVNMIIWYRDRFNTEDAHIEINNLLNYIEHDIKAKMFINCADLRKYIVNDMKDPRSKSKHEENIKQLKEKNEFNQSTYKQLMIICILIEIIVGIICKSLGANEIGTTALIILSVASWICKHLSGDRIGIIGFTIDGIIPMTIGMLIAGIISI